MTEGVPPLVAFVPFQPGRLFPWTTDRMTVNYRPEIAT